MSDSSKAHVLILPYPSQGHINPMLQFAKKLASKGPKSTLITTSFILNSVKAHSDMVQIQTISDGFDETGYTKAVTLDAYIARFEDIGSKSLLNLIERKKHTSQPFTCIVYDTFVPWGLDVAKRVGLAAVAFSTQSCVVSAIYYYVNKSLAEVPQVGSSVSVAGSVLLERSDFPSFALMDGSYPTLAKCAMEQFNLGKLDWILFNSFDKLESDVLTSLKEHWRPLAIGPTVPLPSTDGKNQDQVPTYGMSLIQIADSRKYMNWLDTKSPASVVYVSFGSFASLDSVQMNELAVALASTGHPFLWVVRSSEQKNLPTNFIGDVGEDRGLVVPWTHQLAVLSHRSVGCFVTHSGWNSTLEALSLGLPMVAMPQWTDQLTNAKYVEDVWKVGVRVRRGDDNVVRSEEVARCLTEVMRSQEMRRNASKWKREVEAALEEGGSSDASLNEFVRFVNGKGAEEVGSSGLNFN